jgi:hypothetical protein
MPERQRLSQAGAGKPVERRQGVAAMFPMFVDLTPVERPTLSASEVNDEL